MLTAVGMGPAGLHSMTPAVRKTVATADVLVGGKRHLQQFPDFTGEQFAFGANILELLSWISAYQEKHVVVLVSGGPLLYGIGTRMVTHLGIENMRIIPDISAAQYLYVQSGIDTNDMWSVSNHGRSVCFDELTQHSKVVMVTGALCGPREITQQSIARGKGHRWMVIGESPVTENEQIHFLPVCEVDVDYDMSAVVVLDEG